MCLCRVPALLGREWRTRRRREADNRQKVNEPDELVRECVGSRLVASGAQRNDPFKGGDADNDTLLYPTHLPPCKGLRIRSGAQLTWVQWTVESVTARQKRTTAVNGVADKSASVTD